MALISQALKQQFADLLTISSAVIHRHAQAPIQDELAQLQLAASEQDQRDNYGVGGVIEHFEHQLSALFKKPACVFIPTGTLAQCIALKCYSEQSGRNVIGLHPTSHLLLHEYMAVEKLWGLTSQRMGTHSNALTLDDVLQLDPTAMAAIIVEIPMREIGGALPTWNDLLAIRDWCKTHNVMMHLDGARLWQVTEFYACTLADIAALFDSVYVSFYKDLGGISGAALLGSSQLIEASKIWARRAGGNPITLYPEVIAARSGLNTYLPIMSKLIAYTRELCSALKSAPIKIQPEEPQTAMFHLTFNMSADTLTQKIINYAKQSGIVVLPLPRSGNETSCCCEVSIGDQAIKHAPDFWASHITNCLSQ